MHEIQNIQSDTIFSAIKNVSLRLNINAFKTRGQCYDMASTIADRKYGVAAKLSKEEQELCKHSVMVMHSIWHVQTH